MFWSSHQTLMISYAPTLHFLLSVMNFRKFRTWRLQNTSIIEWAVSYYQVENEFWFHSKYVINCNRISNYYCILILDFPKRINWKRFKMHRSNKIHGILFSKPIERMQTTLLNTSKTMLFDRRDYKNICDP